MIHDSLIASKPIHGLMPKTVKSLKYVEWITCFAKLSAALATSGNTS